MRTDGRNLVQRPFVSRGRRVARGAVQLSGADGQHVEAVAGEGRHGDGVAGAALEALALLGGNVLRAVLVLPDVEVPSKGATATGWFWRQIGSTTYTCKVSTKCMLYG